MRIARLSAIVLIATATWLPGQTTNALSTGSRSIAAISKALASLGPKSVDIWQVSGASFNPGGISKAKNCLDKRSAELKERIMLPSALVTLAEEIGKIEQNMGLHLELLTPQKLTTIQQILGKEDSVREVIGVTADGDPENVWCFRYGSWEFQAAHGLVKSVLIYCTAPAKK